MDNKHSATDHALQPNYRRARAQSLTSAVLCIAEKYLCDCKSRSVLRDFSNELLDEFYRSGVEVITDEDRRKAGLAPRNDNGLTPDELRAIEMRRLELLSKPLSFTAPAAAPPGSPPKKVE